MLAAELEELAANWPDRGGLSSLVPTRETSASARAERPSKRPRTAAVVRGSRIDAPTVQTHLARPARSMGGGEAGRRDAVMTMISGPSGFDGCCKELVLRHFTPAERGEVAELDA